MNHPIVGPMTGPGPISLQMDQVTNSVNDLIYSYEQLVTTLPGITKKVHSIHNETEQMAIDLEKRTRSLIDGYDYLDGLASQVPQILLESASSHRKQLQDDVVLLTATDKQSLLKQEEQLKLLKGELRSISHERVIMDVLTRPIINETKRAYNDRLDEVKEQKERIRQEKLNGSAGIRNNSITASNEKTRAGYRGDGGTDGGHSISGNHPIATTIVKARDHSIPIFIPEYKPPSTTSQQTSGGLSRSIHGDPSSSGRQVYARAVGGGIMVPSMRQGSLPAEVQGLQTTPVSATTAQTYMEHEMARRLRMKRRSRRTAQTPAPVIKSLQQGYENTQSEVVQLRRQMAATSEEVMKQQLKARRKLEAIALELQHRQVHRDNELVIAVKALIDEAMQPLKDNSSTTRRRDDMELLEALHYLLAPDELMSMDDGDDATMKMDRLPSKMSTINSNGDTGARHVSFKDDGDQVPQNATNSPSAQHPSSEQSISSTFSTTESKHDRDESIHNAMAMNASSTSTSTTTMHHPHHPVLFCLEGDHTSGVRWVASDELHAPTSDEPSADFLDSNHHHLQHLPFDRSPPPAIVRSHHQYDASSTNVTNMSHIAAVTTGLKSTDMTTHHYHHNNLNTLTEPASLSASELAATQMGHPPMDQPPLNSGWGSALDYFPSENAYYLQQDAMLDRLRRDGPNWLSKVGVIRKATTAASTSGSGGDGSSDEQKTPDAVVHTAGGGVERELVQLMHAVVQSHQQSIHSVVQSHENTMQGNQALILALINDDYHHQPPMIQQEEPLHAPVNTTALPATIHEPEPTIEEEGMEVDDDGEYFTALGKVLLGGSLLEGPYAIDRVAIERDELFSERQKLVEMKMDRWRKQRLDQGFKGDDKNDAENAVVLKDNDGASSSSVVEVSATASDVAAPAVAQQQDLPTIKIHEDGDDNNNHTHHASDGDEDYSEEFEDDFDTASSSIKEHQNHSNKHTIKEISRRDENNNDINNNTNTINDSTIKESNGIDLSKAPLNTISPHMGEAAPTPIHPGSVIATTTTATTAVIVDHTSPSTVQPQGIAQTLSASSLKPPGLRRRASASTMKTLARMDAPQLLPSPSSQHDDKTVQSYTHAIDTKHTDKDTLIVITPELIASKVSEGIQQGIAQAMALTMMIDSKSKATRTHQQRNNTTTINNNNNNNIPKVIITSTGASSYEGTDSSDEDLYGHHPVTVGATASVSHRQREHYSYRGSIPVSSSGHRSTHHRQGTLKSSATAVSANTRTTISHTTPSDKDGRARITTARRGATTTATATAKDKNNTARGLPSSLLSSSPVRRKDPLLAMTDHQIAEDIASSQRNRQAMVHRHMEVDDESLSLDEEMQAIAGDDDDHPYTTSIARGEGIRHSISSEELMPLQSKRYLTTHSSRAEPTHSHTTTSMQRWTSSSRIDKQVHQQHHQHYHQHTMIPLVSRVMRQSATEEVLSGGQLSVPVFSSGRQQPIGAVGNRPNTTTTTTTITTAAFVDEENNTDDYYHDNLHRDGGDTSWDHIHDQPIFTPMQPRVKSSEGNHVGKRISGVGDDDDGSMDHHKRKGLGMGGGGNEDGFGHRTLDRKGQLRLGHLLPIQHRDNEVSSSSEASAAVGDDDDDDPSVDSWNRIDGGRGKGRIDGAAAMMDGRTRAASPHSKSSSGGHSYNDDSDEHGRYHSPSVSPTTATTTTRDVMAAHYMLNTLVMAQSDHPSPHHANRYVAHNTDDSDDVDGRRASKSRPMIMKRDVEALFSSEDGPLRSSSSDTGAYSSSYDDDDDSGDNGGAEGQEVTRPRIKSRDGSHDTGSRDMEIKSRTSSSSTESDLMCFSGSTDSGAVMDARGRGGVVRSNQLNNQLLKLSKSTTAQSNSNRQLLRPSKAWR